MRKILFVSLFFIGLIGCGKKVPDEIIQPDEMEDLLYDYHIVSSMVNDLPYSENYKKGAYLKYVFQKHRVDEANFDSSMVWYTRHTEELATIYQNLQKRYTDEENRLKEQARQRDSEISISMSGDTVNLWQDQSLYWLTASDLTNQITFDFKADTTFKAFDAVEWITDVQFLSKQKMSTAKLVMGICYYFDNDSIQGVSRIISRNGEQRLYVRPDSAFNIQNIKGFCYFMDEGDSTASVLLNDIHFIRYHDMRRPVLSNSVDGNVITTDTVRRIRHLNRSITR